MTNIDMLKHVVDSMSGANVRPLCSKHEPKVFLDREQGMYIVNIHCDNCHFTAWIHPDTYYDMMVDNMLDEVEESIKNRRG